MYNPGKVNSSILLERSEYYLNTLDTLKRTVIYSIDDYELSLKLYSELEGPTDGLSYTEIPYHLNLVGLVSILDSPITILSLDTGEEIEFDKPTLLNNPLTLEAYRTDSSLRAQLIRDNLNRKTLIYGAITEVTMDQLVEPEHCEVLYYPDEMFEVNELQLKTRLQNEIYKFRDRWYLPGYTVIDELYAAGFTLALSSNLPLMLMNLRESNINTVSAHSYFVKAKLASNGIDPTDLEYLTLRQRIYLYKNIEWLRKHQGTDRVLKELANVLFFGSDIQLSAFRALLTNSDEPIALTERLTFDNIEVVEAYQLIDVMDDSVIETVPVSTYRAYENAILDNHYIANTARKKAVTLLEHAVGRTSLLVTEYTNIVEPGYADRVDYALKLLTLTAGSQYDIPHSFQNITHRTGEWTTVLLIGILAYNNILPELIDSSIPVDGVFNGTNSGDVLTRQYVNLNPDSLTTLTDFTSIISMERFEYLATEGYEYYIGLDDLISNETVGDVTLAKRTLFQDYHSTLPGAGLSPEVYLGTLGLTLEQVSTEEFLSSLMTLLTGFQLTIGRDKSELEDSVITIVKNFLSYERDIVSVDPSVETKIELYSDGEFMDVEIEELTLVPVSLYGGYSLFGTDGELDAIFEGLTTSTQISWEVLEGSVDTYETNAGRDGLEFTSDNSDFKLFRVYTNEGTEFEQSDTAGYYHHPIDHADPEAVTEGIKGVMSNPHYPDANYVEGNLFGGMIPVDHTLTGYDDINRNIRQVYSFDGSNGDYTELTINKDFIEDNGLVVRELAVYSLVNGTWRFDDTINGEASTVLRFSSNEYLRKLVFQMYRDGYEWFIDVEFQEVPSPGVSTRYSPEGIMDGTTGAASEIDTRLSKIIVMSIDDYHTHMENLSGRASDIYTVLQSLKSYDVGDQHTHQEAETGTASNILTFLQTALSVT